MAIATGLTVQCSACGAEIPLVARANFCPACGIPLNPAAEETDHAPGDAPGAHVTSAMDVDC